MSLTLMAKAMGVKVGNSLRKLVLIKLADSADKNGVCWPSHQHVADQCECSKSAVRSHIDALEGMGLLRRENRLGENNGKGNTSNKYYLNLDADPMPSDGTTLCQQKAQGCHQEADPMPSDGTPPMPADGTRISNSFEPVTEPTSTVGAGSFISDAALKRYGLPVDGKIPYPPKFTPSEEHKKIAQEQNADLENELLNFSDYHRSRGTYLLDWNSAFNVWLRKARPLHQKSRREGQLVGPHWNSPESWEDFL